MNEQLDKANQAANWFEAFIPAHPFVVAIVVAIVCSWTITLAVKPFVPSGVWKARGLRAFDIAVAFGICARMWPGDHRLLWALLIGTSSPVAYWIVTGLLGWKLPSLKRFFTLRELAADDSPDTGDDTRVPPGDTQ